MRRLRMLALVVAAGVVFVVGAAGQHAARKPVYTPKPAYPPVLKSNRIGGLVKLEVVVAASGAVEKVSVRGGNPILAEAAAGAVKWWKYAPADGQTIEEVEVKFTPTEEATLTNNIK